MPNIGPVAKGVVGYVADMTLTKLPQAAAPFFNSAMIKLIDRAIDGVGVLPGAKQTAGWQLARSGSVPAAVDAIQLTHTVLATAQGVVANIGGLVSAIVGTPVDATGLIVIQIRMVAGIAHLHGYDIDNPRVRTAIAMCLLGERELERQIDAGRLPTTPLAVATSPVYDPQLHADAADRVLSHALGEAAGKGIIVGLARRTPIIGGGVGGVSDLLNTRVVAHSARKQFPPRRV